MTHTIMIHICVISHGIATAGDEQIEHGR